jgi:hypothetical protein
MLRSTILDNVTYTSDILIGTCYRPSGSTAPEDCTTLAGQPNDPGTAPAGYVKSMRVMVLTTWSSTTQTCGDGTCSYQVQSLIDPNDDIVWNNITRPVAIDDNSSTPVGTSVDIPVLSNDAIGPVTTNPVQNVAMTVGSGTAAATADGKIRYTAPANASGLMELTYRLKDQAGRLSNTATVRIKVTGIAKPDTATVQRGKQVTIPVTVNDLGSPTEVQVVDGSVTGGTAVPTGTSVLFTAPAAAGTYTFGYFFTDAGGVASSSTTVTVTVTTWAPALAPDLLVVLPASASTTSVPFDMATKTSNPAGVGYTYQVESVTNVQKEKLLVNGTDYGPSNKKGTDLGFREQGNALGGGTFTYRAFTPDGVPSATTGTATIVVVPVAVDDAVAVAKGATTPIQVGNNDVPNNFNGVVTFSATAVSTPTCGSIPVGQPDAQNGIIRFKAPSSVPVGGATCTFTYHFTGAAPYASVVSNDATVTVTVN